MKKEEITVEEFYKQVQGHLYDLDCSTELIKLASVDLDNEITNKIATVWMDGEESTYVIAELIKESYEKREFKS